MNQKIIETALAINFLCERYDQATSSTELIHVLTVFKKNNGNTIGIQKTVKSKIRYKS